MICNRPFRRGSSSSPCGKCAGCITAAKRVWVHRAMLENACHGDSVFVNLTYDDDSLPVGGVLVKRHLQLWFKSLRNNGGHFRYLGCGEYGERSLRPHYHLIMFGLSMYHEKAFSELWEHGFVHVGTVTEKSISYVCGYVAKKMGDPVVVNGVSEFPIHSRRPGIGALALPRLVSFMRSPDGERFLMENGDVPAVLRHGGKLWPLGQFLRRKLRVALGLSEKACDQEAFHRRGRAMSILSSRALYLQDVEAQEALKPLYEPQARPAAVERVKRLHSIYRRKESL